RLRQALSLIVAAFPPAAGMQRNGENPVRSRGRNGARELDPEAAREPGALSELERVNHELGSFVVEPCRPHHEAGMQNAAHRLAPPRHTARAQRKRYSR